MKFKTKILTLNHKHKSRRTIVLAGVVLSFFLIYDFRAQETNIDDFLPHITTADSATIIETRTNQPTGEQARKYHNFLSAYFIQESAHERSGNKDEQDREIFTNLETLRTIVVARTTSLFR